MQFFERCVVNMMNKTVFCSKDVVSSFLYQHRIIIVLKHADLVPIIQQAIPIHHFLSDNGTEQWDTVHVAVHFIHMLPGIVVGKGSQFPQIAVLHSNHLLIANRIGDCANHATLRVCFHMFYQRCKPAAGYDCIIIQQDNILAVGLLDGLIVSPGKAAVLLIEDHLYMEIFLRVQFA